MLVSKLVKKGQALGLIRKPTYYIVFKVSVISQICKVCLLVRYGPHFLFKVLNSIVNPAVMLCSVLHFVKTLFTNFLWKKILLSDLHHLRLKHSCLYLLSAKLEQFEPVSPSSKGDGSGYKIFIFSIRLCSPFDSTGPTILALINNSLASGRIPAAFKHVVLQSLIKKKNLDPADLSNYRPIYLNYHFCLRFLKKLF